MTIDEARKAERVRIREIVESMLRCCISPAPLPDGAGMAQHAAYLVAESRCQGERNALHMLRARIAEDTERQRDMEPTDGS